MYKLLTTRKLLTAAAIIFIVGGVTSFLYGDRRARRFGDEVQESPIFGRRSWYLSDEIIEDWYLTGQLAKTKSHVPSKQWLSRQIKRLEHFREHLLAELNRHPSSEREKGIRAYLERIDGQLKALKAVELGEPLAVNELFNETIVGSILVSWPRIIRKGESRAVTVSLKTEVGGNVTFKPQNQDERDRESMLRDSGLMILSPALRQDNIFSQAGNSWAAKLVTGAFEALNSTPEEQAYGVDKAEWSWTLSPKEGFEGRQIVNVAVEARYTETPVAEPTPARGKGKKAEGREGADAPKEEPRDSSYTIHSAELPVEIELGWVDWTKLKVGGLLAILAGAGATIPYLLSKAKSFREQQNPQRRIGF